MNDELMASALIGDEAKKFLESDLGKVIIGIADQEVDLAKEKLLDVDPDDIKAVRKLQHQAEFGIAFKSWLYNLLNEGEQAMAAFKQQEQE